MSGVHKRGRIGGVEERGREGEGDELGRPPKRTRERERDREGGTSGRVGGTDVALHKSMGQGREPCEEGRGVSPSVWDPLTGEVKEEVKEEVPTSASSIPHTLSPSLAFSGDTLPEREELETEDAVVTQLRDVLTRERETLSIQQQCLSERERLLGSLSRQHGERAERAGEMERVCTALRSELEVKSTEICTLQQQLADLTPAFTAAVDSRREAESKAAILSGEIHSLQQQLSELTTALTTAVDKRREAEAKVSILSEDICGLRKRAARSSAAVQDAAALVAAHEREADERGAEAILRVQRERESGAGVFFDEMVRGRVDLSALGTYVERYGDICDLGEEYTPESESEDSAEYEVSDSDSQSESCFESEPQPWTDEQFEDFYQGCKNTELCEAIRQCRVDGGSQLCLSGTVENAYDSQGIVALREVTEIRLEDMEIGWIGCVELLHALPQLLMLEKVHIDSLSGNAPAVQRLVAGVALLHTVTEISIRDTPPHECIQSLLLSLPHRPHLRKLSLTCCGQSDDVVPLLTHALRKTNIRELKLDWEGLDYGGALTLAPVDQSLQGLRKLSLKSVSLQCLTVLSQVQCLRELTISRPLTPVDCRELSCILGNTISLTKLSLDIGENGSNSDAIMLFGALGKLTRIRRLHLRLGVIGDIGTQKLASVLREFSCLTELYLGNEVRGRPFSAQLKLGDTFSHLLRSVQGLKELTIWLPNITECSLAGIAGALRKMTTIESLTWCSCMGIDDFESLPSLVRNLENLSQLSLPRYCTRKSGFVKLVSELAMHPHVSKVVLGDRRSTAMIAPIFAESRLTERKDICQRILNKW
ncbi:hypothetical protein KIPB_002675 [Kipferlia bialata]|uniref:Uncharacterized protein n=1 Tax=Kipferlia bialata TaxID=797122 RepID=A0A391NUY4_9EUKA|nr:hypothetical protein KIPB_002675 [Kipferlia bialata]|eukprot:g2675.t1